MRIPRVFPILVSTLALASCSQGSTGPQFTKDDVTTITNTIEELEKDFNAKDADKISALFSPNAVLMPPNQATARARDAIKQFYVARFGEGATDLQLEARDIGGSGPLAYASGDYRLNLAAGEGGEPRRDRGKFMWIFREADGRWLIEYVMFSSDFAPRPAQPQPAE